MPEIIVYTGPACSWCKRAIELLDERGLRYSLRNVLSSKDSVEEFKKRTGNADTVPQILVGDHLIGGHDDLLAVIDTPFFSTLIGDQ